jgi:F-type H+-transporting ATPase subunit b
LDPKLLAFELINFVVLMLILRRYLFRPVRETLERRREEIERRNTEIAGREAAAREAEQRYRAQLLEIEVEGERLRSEARRRGREEAEQIVAAAREAMDASRANAEEEQAACAERALQRLRPQLLELALEAALRVARGLSREELVVEYALEAARQLQREAPHADALEVRHSPDADPAGVEAALREVLGAGPKLELVTDPELVAGVRLQAGDLEVEASAGASLDDWARELRAAA